MSFELFVAVRYLLARRKQAFISLISFISVVGVGVGVMALLIALALMTGLQSELRDRLVGSTAHVYVWKVGGIDNPEGDIKRLRDIPEVRGAAPVVLGQGLVTSAGATAPVMVKGIDPELEAGVTDIGRAIKAGSLQGIVPREGAPAGIVLGKDLATKLGVNVGDLVQVFTAEGGTLSPLGMLPKYKSFKVAGIFSMGLYEFDSGYGFVHLSAAERLFDKKTPELIELRVSDLFKARGVADGIRESFGSDYIAQDWADMNQPLFRALWLEKMAISITIGLIVMVAALNIVASLILLVMEKSRDIAILKTMGTSARSIRRIFVLQGLIIGIVGTVAGAIGGLTIIYILDRFKLIHVPMDVYQIAYVPFKLQPFDAVVVIASAVVICLVATIYPSRQASKLDPAQALRYQ